LLASATLFAMMALCTRLASARIPGAQIALVRFGLGIVVVALMRGAGRVVLRPRHWKWLGARGLFGGLAVVTYFGAIQHVGVGIATLLNYTAPVWSMLFSWALLGERPRRNAVAALVLTLGGVVLVAGRSASVAVGFWQFAGVFSAISSGIAVTSIRAVRRPDASGEPGESAWTVFASFTTLGFLATLPFVLGRWVAPAPHEWLVIVAVAVISIGGQLLMTQALEHITAPVSGIISQLTVVLALGGGLLFFQEQLTTRAVVGSVLTMAGVVWIVLSASLVTRRRQG
jgi:drug/metabolite transporter (DMT)-like permease